MFCTYLTGVVSFKLFNTPSPIISVIAVKKSMHRISVINRSITAKNEDVTILYDIFKNMGKVILVNDLKNDFYAIFNSGNRKEVEARFWDSLTTLQYMGFLTLSDNDEKVTKLDFALLSVCNIHLTPNLLDSYNRE